MLTIHPVINRNYQVMTSFGESKKAEDSEQEKEQILIEEYTEYANERAKWNSRRSDMQGMVDDKDAPVDTYQSASDSLNRGFYGVSDGATIEDYLSAKVGFDMNAFDVPVKLTLATMDIVNNPYFDLEAATAVAGFDITAFAGYQYLKDMGKSNAIHVGGEVAYTIEPVGKLSAKTTFLTVIPEEGDAANAMSLELGLENTTLVTGATLKAGYKTWNLIDNDYMFTQDMGEIYVSATIEF